MSWVRELIVFNGPTSRGEKLILDREILMVESEEGKYRNRAHWKKVVKKRTAKEKNVEIDRPLVEPEGSILLKTLSG